MLAITFDNNTTTSLELLDNSVAQSLGKMAKHLHRMPLRFSNFDNPYAYTREIATSQLMRYSKLLGIEVDETQTIEQLYLNQLHTIYERRYDGNSNWLQYHEAIHILENVNRGTVQPTANLSYGEAAGPLDRNYSWDELELCQTKFVPGDCYVNFSELGKIPFVYWRDKEPNDIKRLCQL